VTNLFPMFLKLEGRQVLVVGAGKIGEPKIGGLLETGARIRVVSLDATPAVRQWAREGKVELELRAFSVDDLARAFLAVVATNSRTLNERVYHEAQRRGVLCNVVDVPDLCDFFYPAVVRRGDLQIAVSTAGQTPSLAQKIRQQLEKQFGPGYAAWVAELGETRRLILASDLDKQRKLDLLHSLASREALEAALAELSEPELAAKGEGA
jgi:precorrin-2 dehydrogenase / sirohydrochlorin ferrochelatase